MKKLLIILLCLPFAGFGQVSKEDESGIKRTCLDYVEGFFTKDTARLQRGLHPELVKRIIDNRSGKSQLSNMSLLDLVSYAKSADVIPDPKPGDAFKAKVDIYDVSNGIALAKIATNKMPSFFDYVQLGKINGEWKIINVLWAFYS